MVQRVNPDSAVGVEIPRNFFFTAGHRGMLAEQVVFGAVALTRGVNLVTNNAYNLRGHLPDPIDIPNHIGNSAVTVALLASFMQGFDGRRPKPATPEQIQARNRRAAYTIGAIAVTANVLGETVGYGSISTPDFYDFLYGLAGGALVYRWTKPAYIPPETVKTLKSTLPKDDMYRQFVEGIVPDLPQPKQKLSSGAKAHKKHPYHRGTTRRNRRR